MKQHQIFCFLAFFFLAFLTPIPKVHAVDISNNIPVTGNQGAVGDGDAGTPGGTGDPGYSNSTDVGILTNTTNGSYTGGVGGDFAGIGGAGIENLATGTITNLENLGSITGGSGGIFSLGGSAGAGGAGVSNLGTVTTFNNSGAVNGGAGASSNGSAESGGVGGSGIDNLGVITTLNNATSGSITGGTGGGDGNSSGGSGGDAINNSGTIATLENSGSIVGGNGGQGFTGSGGNAGSAGAGIRNSGTISTLENIGSVTGGTGGKGNIDSSIGGAGGAAIVNTSTVVNLINSGTLTGGAGGVGSSTQGGAPGYDGGPGGVGIDNSATITTLTNTGSVVGGLGGAGGVGLGGFPSGDNGVAGVGIINSTGTIQTLNNLQGAGNVNGALTFKGNLPTNYKVIIYGPAEYGQLAVTNPNGATTFGVSALSGQITVSRYTSVISGVTASNLTNEASALSPNSYGDGGLWYLEDSNADNAWDLVFVRLPSSGPSASDTLESFRPNAAALRNAFNLQSAKIAQGLSYDCTVFDTKNICVSFAGSRSDGKEGLSSTTGALILAYKLSSMVRLGGYIDQNIGSSDSGGVRVKRGSPGYGVFGVWSQNADGSGVQFRAAANYSAVNIETTRAEIDSAEPGFGKSEIMSNGFRLEFNHSYALSSSWSARPYAGYRQTTNRRTAYTEIDDVTTPLTYSGLKQNSQSFLAGVRVSGLIAQKTVMTWSAGLEHDIKNDVDRYAATGVNGLESINMESGAKKARPTVSLEFAYDIHKTERIGLSIARRQEAFESASTTSGLIQYAKGF